jgi:hypothetical protein
VDAIERQPAARRGGTASARQPLIVPPEAVARGRAPQPPAGTHCEQTRKTKSDTPVYSAFSRNGTLRSACRTSGSTLRNGRTRCSTRKPPDMAPGGGAKVPAVTWQ